MQKFVEIRKRLLLLLCVPGCVWLGVFECKEKKFDDNDGDQIGRILYDITDGQNQR